MIFIAFGVDQPLNQLCADNVKRFSNLFDTKIDTYFDTKIDTYFDTRFVIDFDIVKIYNVVKWSNYGRTKH